MSRPFSRKGKAPSGPKTPKAAASKPATKWGLNPDDVDAKIVEAADDETEISENNEQTVDRDEGGWLIQCAPGLAKVVQKELNFFGATTRDQKNFVRLQRNHDLIFLNRTKSDEGFAKIRTAETVLRCPAYGRFKISQRQLTRIADELKKIGPRRLVVTVAGNHFQRHDLQRFVMRAAEERGYEFDPTIEDEVWMFCIDESWYFGIPLAKARDAAGRERAEERAGSLPPAIGAAMAFSSQPLNTDVVFDPTCGSGTLLTEFYAYAPQATLIGCDIDPKAIGVAKSNFAAIASDLGPRLKLINGDSRKTDLLEASTSLMLANLPFGVQFGDKATNADLYAEIFREGLRLKNASLGWRGIFLTSDTEAFETALRAVPDLSQEVLFKVKIRGELATCYKVRSR